MDLRVAALLLVACRPDRLRVVSAEDWGVVEQSDDIQGRDGGTSARLWGLSVWTFGDTVLNVEDEYGQTWHHNSVSWTEDADAGDGITGFAEPQDSAGAPAHLVPPSDDELVFNLAHAGDPCAEEPCGARWAVWPGQPVWDEAGQRALMYYGLIYAEPGDFNFEGVGDSIAVWTDPDGLPERPVIDAAAEHPDLMWEGGEWAHGVASVIEGEHLYSLDCRQTWRGHRCILGRAGLEQVQEASAWEYRSGDGWTGDVERAEELFTGAPIMSLSWAEGLGAWLLVYSRALDHDVVARTATELWGPWSRERVLFRVSGDAPYDAVHHAELEEEDGLVQYITWSRGTDEGWFGAEFPIERVTLEP